jgi:hypothetical protein
MTSMSNAATTLKQRLDLIQNAMEEYRSGGWGASRGEAAQWFQGWGRFLGADPKQLDNFTSRITGGQLDALQAFNSLVGPYLLSEIKGDLQGTRIMRPEVDTILSTITPNMDERAIQTTLNDNARYRLRVMYDKNNKFQSYVDGIGNGTNPLPLAQFDSWYNNQFKAADLPNKTPQGEWIGSRPVYLQRQDLMDYYNHQTSESYPLSETRMREIMKKKFGGKERQ